MKVRRPNFPEIRGFEFFPEGRLLAQVIDFARPVGIAYERCIGYTKPRHTHDRFTISFARGSSRSEMEIFPEAKVFKLDESCVHLMADEKEHEQRSLSAVYDTFALFPEVSVLEQTLRELALSKSERWKFLATTQKIKRSRLLEEAVDRYFFSRVVAPHGEGPAEWEGYERLILKEVVTLATFGSNAGRPPTPATRLPETAGTAVSRALEFIESHLFDEVGTKEIVRAARSSQATLFRQFAREIGMSPFEYVRSRRLDEAASLLRSGQYQVGDVALLVGYEDLSAFSKAFKRRFAQPPSQLIPDRPPAK